MIIVVIGVAGSGKSTVGLLLARALGCEYLEGDELHSAASIRKMSRGIPLTDADRVPWLEAIHARLLEAFRSGRTLVAACSALKERYRAVLARGVPVTWVSLQGSPDLVLARLRARTGHFMSAAMLDGQLAAWEPPQGAIVADVSRPPDEIVERVLAELPWEPRVHVADDLEALSLRAAGAIARAIDGVVRATGRCSLALSGGSTPGPLYRLLATRFRDAVPWAEVHVFWTDERWVPPDDPRSNQRMAREALLDHVPCPAGNVHPMPTHFADPGRAAREYEATLAGWFAGARPRFDLAILGLGADGHTASLFPGSAAVREEARGVLAVTGPADPPRRLTLTLPVLARSARSHFLVAGAGKAPEVRRVLSGAADPEVFPAARIHRAPGEVVWWIDREAADAAASPGTHPLEERCRSD